MMLPATSNSGFHDFAGDCVLACCALPVERSTDLGAGLVEMADGLDARESEVPDVDRDTRGFAAQLPHHSVDFSRLDFVAQLGPDSLWLPRGTLFRLPTIALLTRYRSVKTHTNHRCLWMR